MLSLLLEFRSVRRSVLLRMRCARRSASAPGRAACATQSAALTRVMRIGEDDRAWNPTGPGDRCRRH